MTKRCALCIILLGVAASLSGCGQQPEGGGGDQDDRGMHRSSLPTPMHFSRHAATRPA